MQIPAEFDALIRQLAKQRFDHTYHTFELLSRQCAADHADVIKARLLLDEAEALNALVGEPPKGPEAT